MGHIVVWLCHLDVDREKWDTHGLWGRELWVFRGVGVGLGGGDMCLGYSAQSSRLPTQLPVMLIAMYFYTTL